MRRTGKEGSILVQERRTKKKPELAAAAPAATKNLPPAVRSPLTMLCVSAELHDACRSGADSCSQQA